jgi:hypothetical protein
MLCHAMGINDIHGSLLDLVLCGSAKPQFSSSDRGGIEVVIGIRLTT